jgi:hypothetical protein
MQSALDPCLFYYGHGTSFSIIYFYVDDILIFTKYGSDQGRVLKEKFFARFKCKDLGRAKRFLGVWIEQASDFSSLCLHQSPYCVEICDRHKEWVTALYPSQKKTPLPQDIQERLGKEEKLPEPGDKIYDWWDTMPYLQMIGAALYLAINTRPDIMFAVCLLARYSKSKPLSACKGLCWLFSYLSGTSVMGLKYSSFTGDTFADILDLFGFTDANWASDIRTRRSTAGFVVFACGGPLAWGSKLMVTVAASSMESEYMAAFYLGQQLIYIRNLLSEIGLPISQPTPFLMDAMAAIQSLKNHVFHARTKHVAVKWHWLRQKIGTVFSLYHVRSEDMTADILTKMAIIRVWSNLLPHLMGLEVRSSKCIIDAQLREKGASFPSDGIEKA